MFKIFTCYPRPWWEDVGLHDGQTVTDLPIRQCYYFGTVQGAEDQIAPPENGMELKRELGDRATLVNVPGAAHFLPLEQPADSCVSRHRFHPAA